MKASVDIQNKNIDSKSSSQNHNSINKRNLNAFKTLTFLLLIYVFSIVPGRLFMYAYGHYFTFVKNDLVFDTKHYALLWTSMVAKIYYLSNHGVIKREGEISLFSSHELYSKSFESCFSLMSRCRPLGNQFHWIFLINFFLANDCRYNYTCIFYTFLVISLT